MYFQVDASLDIGEVVRPAADSSPVLFLLEGDMILDS